MKDHQCSLVLNLSSWEKKAWQKIQVWMGFEPIYLLHQIIIKACWLSVRLPVSQHGWCNLTASYNRFRTGRGKPGKSWNLLFLSFPGLGSHGKLCWLYKLTNLGRCSCQFKHNQTGIMVFFGKLLRKWSDLGHGKLKKVIEFQKPRRVQTLFYSITHCSINILSFFIVKCSTTAVDKDGSNITKCYQNVSCRYT